MRGAQKQRGEGRLGTIVSLALLGLFGWVAFHVGPVYIADYSLGDVIIQTARRPQPRFGDKELLDKWLMPEVRNLGLHNQIKRTDFKIETRDGIRKISVKYSRTVEVLPSYEHTFTFEHNADERYF